MRPSRGRRQQPTPQCSSRLRLGTSTVHTQRGRGATGLARPGDLHPPKWVPHVALSSPDEALWLHKLDAGLRCLRRICIVNARAQPSLWGAGFLPPSTFQIGPTPATWGRQDPLPPPWPQPWEIAPTPSQPVSWGGHCCPTASSRQFLRWYLCPLPPQQICTHLPHPPTHPPTPAPPPADS